MDEGCDDDNDNYCDGGMTKQGTVVVSTCSATPSAATFGNDCNDANASFRPGAVESCDGADNDCDGLTDEGC